MWKPACASEALACAGVRLDSNQHPSDGQSAALPVELHRGRVEGVTARLLRDKSLFRTVKAACASSGRHPERTMVRNGDSGYPSGMMRDTLRLTIAFDEPDEQGWIVARVVEVPGALSQGRTREEARENVIDALRLMLTPDDDDPSVSGERTEPLDLTMVA
jgi:predicted RNase H-like HicB family nuclease